MRTPSYAMLCYAYAVILHYLHLPHHHPDIPSLIHNTQPLIHHPSHVHYLPSFQTHQKTNATSPTNPKRPPSLKRQGKKRHPKHLRKTTHQKKIQKKKKGGSTQSRTQRTPHTQSLILFLLPIPIPIAPNTPLFLLPNFGTSLPSSCCSGGGGGGA